VRIDWIFGRKTSGSRAGPIARASSHYKAGRLAEAEAELRALLAADAGLHEAQYVLGHVLRDSGRLEEALVSYQKAIALKPDFADAYVAWGNVLNDHGKPDEAAALYLEAIKHDPDAPDAYANLGNSLQYMGQLDRAIICYQQALALDSGHTMAHLNLGNAYGAMNRPDEASACFRKALALDGDFVEARWALAMSQIPAVCMTDEEPALRRAAFAKELGALHAWFNAHRAANGAKAVGSQQPFFLAYHEENNRDLLGQYGGLCVRLMHDWANRQGVAPSARRQGSGKVRVGVVSEYFWNHSVWSAIVKGWFEQIDTSRFELHAFNLGSRQDEETLLAKQYAAGFEEGSRGLRLWAQAILERRPDVLIYPNIGNDPTALKLASLRLAPVQVTSWGHPETTGLPTLDYFLSSQVMEPVGAQQHYTEKLVCLPHLGTYYRPGKTVAADPQLDKLGLDEGLPILLCPGTPFKYAPRYDRMIVDISRRLGRCQILFFEDESRRYLTDKLKQRLEAALAGAGMRFDEHIIFIPWLDRARYYGLMQRADVLLDSVGFSGFNVAMQAIECCLPIVAWDGRFLRGRLASGILKRMDMPHLVARSEHEYAATVARLARDKEFRDRVRAQIIERRPLLFEDAAPVRAMEDFLAGAAAGRAYAERSP
jgi:protein O-GlcNAc transferase